MQEAEVHILLGSTELGVSFFCKRSIAKTITNINKIDKNKQLKFNSLFCPLFFLFWPSTMLFRKYFNKIVRLIMNAE